jgi:hypothetical protein
VAIMTRPDLTPEQASRLSLAEQHAWFRRATGRRRARLAGGGAGPDATPMLLARADVPDGARVPTFGRHLAFGADPGRQISVAWQVPAPVTGPFLRLGESPDDLGERIAAEVRVLVTRPGDLAAAGSPPPAADPVVQYYLHASLDGLRPGRSYYYSVGHHGCDDPLAAPAAAFRTAPGRRAPFTFTAFGDQGVTDAAVRAARLIRAQGAAFHLHAGDVSYAESGGRGLITDGYDPRVWDSFFAEIEPAARQVPWQLAVGNHELEAWHSPDGYGGQYARWDFPPGAAGAPPVYYWFRYGNVGVVSLDANDVSHEIPANFGYSRGAQTAWLAATLAALRASPEVDFIVAYFHHCAYCTCTGHGSEGGVREFWAPLFDRYAVDLVINGHNHVFERTDPIRDGAPTTQAASGAMIHPGSQGTTYIAAGGGGVGLYAFPAADRHAGRGGSPGTEGHAGPGAFAAHDPHTLRGAGGDTAQTRDAGTVPSFVNRADGIRADESVPWSRVRYTGYCLLVMHSRPGPVRGGTLLVRALAADGAEVDRITLARSSGSPTLVRPIGTAEVAGSLE